MTKEEFRDRAAFRMAESIGIKYTSMYEYYSNHLNSNFIKNEDKK